MIDFMGMAEEEKGGRGFPAEMNSPKKTISDLLSGDFLQSEQCSAISIE